MCVIDTYCGCFWREEFEGEKGSVFWQSRDFVCDFLHCRVGNERSERIREELARS
jgi:hypothetical protein